MKRVWFYLFLRLSLSLSVDICRSRTVRLFILFLRFQILLISLIIFMCINIVKIKGIKSTKNECIHDVSTFARARFSERESRIGNYRLENLRTLFLLLWSVDMIVLYRSIWMVLLFSNSLCRYGRLLWWCLRELRVLEFFPSKMQKSHIT